MSLVHLSTNPREEAARWNFPLGLPGFRFADLNRVRRIAALDRVFQDGLKNADGELFAQYEAYRKCSGEGYGRKAASDIIIRVAAHVGSFVARLQIF